MCIRDSSRADSLRSHVILHGWRMFSHKLNFSEETLRKAEGKEIINYALMNSLLRGRTETTTKRTFEINTIFNVETKNKEIKVETNTI